MEPVAWDRFLREWNAALLGARSVRESVQPEVVASGWLGYPPATPEVLAGAEDRLGFALPPSYRSFLRATNGWRAAGYFVERFLPADEIAWFRERNAEWIESWLEGGRIAEARYGPTPPLTDEQYLVYGEEQRTVDMREEYLSAALQISEEGDGAVYLLNPRVVTPEGEWEAWFFASWLPGARRYRSFWELMQGEYRMLLQLRADEEQRNA